MPIPATGITAVDKAIASLATALTDVSGVFDGIRLIENLPLVAGETKRVVHGLKRKPRGWICVRTSAGASLGYLYDEQSTRTDTDTYLYLRAEGYSPTISLLVF